MSDVIKPQPFLSLVSGGASLKKRVLLRGSFLTQSGYGVHARQVARWALSRPDFDVQIQALPWGMTPWLVDGSLEGGLVGEILARCVTPQPTYDLSVQLQLPNEWDPKLARVNVGLSAVVETDRCNPGWLRAVDAMSRVVVPSHHAKSAFDSTGKTTTRIDVVPECYPDCFRSDETPLLLGVDLPAPFNFLVVGQFTGTNAKNDRKRIHETLRWLCEQFIDDPEVGIVAKVNMGQNSHLDRLHCVQVVKQCLPERVSGFPQVHVVHGHLTPEEMHSLYRHPRIKAFVTCTHGEGFGLPILEAVVAGLPVVAPGWSGHMDYLGLGKFVRLEHDLGEIPDARVDDIFVKGARWANVREQDFKRKVQRLRDSYDEPKRWAEALRPLVLAANSFESVSAAYDRIADELLA